MKLNIKYIYQGYKNYILSLFNILSKEKQILYNKRKNICLSCEYKTNFTNQCSICGCFINQKCKVDYELDKDNLSIDGCPCNPKKW